MQFDLKNNKILKIFFCFYSSKIYVLRKMNWLLKCFFLDVNAAGAGSEEEG